MPRLSQTIIWAAGFWLLLGALQSSLRGQAPTPAGRSMAPVDLTGYYVSIVTEDWRYRMMTPPKGDVASMPLNATARTAANAWDPAKDEAAGEQCMSYGAPALMRAPGRFHFTWQDDNTLRVEADAGTQTRLFHFNAKTPTPGEPSLQGFSAATWQIPGGGRGEAGRGRGGRGPTGGSLKVVTTQLKSGYLRKNGVPYSSSTVLTEYFTRTTEPNGDSWLIITTAVEDPQYLTGVFLTSTHLKRQADSSGWDPSACVSR